LEIKKSSWSYPSGTPDSSQHENCDAFHLKNIMLIHTAIYGNRRSDITLRKSSA
jgi:hypothetical protein